MTLDYDTGLFIVLRLIFDIGRSDLPELNYDIVIKRWAGEIQ